MGDYCGEANIITKVLTGERLDGQRQRRTAEAEVTATQGPGPGRVSKGGKAHPSLGPLCGAQPCPHLGFSPLTLTSAL